MGDAKIFEGFFHFGYMADAKVFFQYGYLCKYVFFLFTSKVAKFCNFDFETFKNT